MSRSFPHNPHAIVKIERPGSDGQSLVIYDSWITKRLIKEISVELTTNASSEGRVTVFDKDFRVIDAFSNYAGTAVITIYLGYGQDLGEPIFKGILAQFERGESDTTLVAYDMAYVMKKYKTSGYKNKKDDIAIIRELVTDPRNSTPDGNLLRFDGPESLGLEPYNAMTRDQRTDWEFMMERARAAGLVIFVRQDTVYARKPARTLGQRPALKIRNRYHFFLSRNWDFVHRAPENLDAKPKVVTVKRRGKGGKAIAGSSGESTNGREETIIKRDSPAPTKAKLSKRAQAQKELDREHVFEGRIQMQLPPNRIRVDYGNIVDVQGVGNLFSNMYVCRTISYRFQKGRLGLELDIYRDIEE